MSDIHGLALTGSLVICLHWLTNYFHKSHLQGDMHCIYAETIDTSRICPLVSNMWGQSLYQENLPALLLIDWRFQNLDTYMLYLSHMIMIIDYVRLSQMVGNDCTWVGWLRQAIEKMHLILLSRPTVPPTDPANPSIDLLIKPNSSSRPNFWCRQGIFIILATQLRVTLRLFTISQERDSRESERWEWVLPRVGQWPV